MVNLPENSHYEVAIKNAGLQLMWFNDIDTSKKCRKKKKNGPEMTKKAEYQISSSVNDGILGIIMTGEIPANAYSDIMRDMFDIIQTNDAKKMLIDVSAVKGRMSITDIYSRVRSYPPFIYKIHVAMVNNNGLGDFERFHETTANNAGQSLKWFTNINVAREWLKSKSNK